MMNDAQHAAQMVAATGAGGKAAASAAAKYTAFGVLGAAVASVSVVMAATTPDKKSDVFICIMSTAITSIIGGTVIGWKYGYAAELVAGILSGNDMQAIAALASIIGIAFCAGLPAWGLVGGLFVWQHRMRGKTIVEIIEDLKRIWK